MRRRLPPSGPLLLFRHRLALNGAVASAGADVLKGASVSSTVTDNGEVKATASSLDADMGLLPNPETPVKYDEWGRRTDEEANSGTTFLFAGLTALGGLYNYTRYSSRQILRTNMGIAGSFVVAGTLINNHQEKYGHVISTVTSVALFGVLTRRYVANRKMIPTGVSSHMAAFHTILQSRKAFDWWFFNGNSPE